MKSILLKHLSLFPEYIRLATRRQAEYKVGFYVFLLNQLFSISLWLIFWKILIDRIGDFGDWTYELIVLLTGFVAVNAGMWLTFIYIWRLPGEILSGSLNSHLIKPVHPFLHMLCKWLNLRSFPRLIMGVAIITFAIIYFDLPFTIPTIIVAGLTSLLSFLAVFLPLAIICLSAFWIGRAEFLRDLFVELFVFQNYPLTEVPSAFIFVFTFVIPLIFSGTIPVLVLTKYSIPHSLRLLLLLLFIVTIQILLFNVLWRKGLRRYESFGG
jgi:ABC-2 type transport system permease protein